MSKNKFSREKHIETGAALGRIRSELMTLLSQVGGAYGNTSKGAKEAGKALEAVIRLRSALDDELARETTREEWDSDRLGRVYFSSSAQGEGES